MTHPLTDEMCADISPKRSFGKVLGEVRYCNDMRAGADWQLEQVIEWIRQNPRVGEACPIYDFETETDRLLLIEDLKEAMRPQGES